ncbi:MAG: hypothetical protein PHZ00_07940 [Candidatus Peribacteraceae bacterium]|nr:hypothetical protein [Candidatus Peribacteraceae bacterium]
MLHLHHRHSLGVSFREARLVGQQGGQSATGNNQLSPSSTVNPILGVSRAGEMPALTDTERRAQTRRKLLELRTSLAGSYDPDIKEFLRKPENIDLLLGCIEYDNGRWRVLPGGAQEILRGLRGLDVQAGVRLEVIKKMMNVEVDEFIDAMTKAKTALADAQKTEADNGGIELTGNAEFQTLKTNVEAFSQKADLLMAQRSALVDAAVEIKGCATRRVIDQTTGQPRQMIQQDLTTALTPIFQRPNAWPVGIHPILSLLQNANALIPVNQALEDALMLAWLQSSMLTIFAAKADEDNARIALSKIDSALVAIESRLASENITRFKAREIYNDQLGGTMPRRILRRCIIVGGDEHSFSLDVLKAQLKNFIDETEAQKICDQVKATLVLPPTTWQFANGRNCVVLGTQTQPFDPKKWEEVLPKLVPLLGTIDQNPAGVSQDHIAELVDEQAIFGEWLAARIGFHTKPTGIDFAALADEINAKNIRKDPAGKEFGIFCWDESDVTKYVAGWGFPAKNIVTDADLRAEAGTATSSQQKEALLKYLGKRLSLDVLDNYVRSFRDDKPPNINIRKIVLLPNGIKPGGTANFTNLLTYLRNNRSIYGDIVEAELIAASNLQKGESIPDKWESMDLEVFLERKIRRQAVKFLTGKDKPPLDATYTQKALAHLEEWKIISGAWGSRWWNWMCEIPDAFTPGEPLEKQRACRRALKDARVTVDGLLHWQTADGRTKADIMDGNPALKLEPNANVNVMKQALEDVGVLQTQIEQANKDIPDATNEAQLNEQVRMLARVGQTVMTQLEQNGLLQERNPTVRRIAFAMAMSLKKDASGSGLEKAKIYLTHPNRDQYLKDIMKDVNARDALLRYQNDFAETRRASGADVLSPLTDIGIRVMNDASLALAKTMDPSTGKPYAVGDTRVENWLSEPAKAGDALRLILYQDPDFVPSSTRTIPVAVDDLLDAFTNRKNVVRNGITVITVQEANRLVSLVQQRVMQKSEDLQLNDLLLRARENRNSPLNFFRSGTKALSKMLHSRDWTEKALGGVLIFGGCYAVYKMWQRGGLARGLVLGVPMFFGADIALEKMTGSGLLERLGMTYMTPEDRQSSLEEFYRRNAKEKRYQKYLSKHNVAQASVQQLNKVPMDKLLLWRKQVNTTGQKDFRSGAPADLAPSAIMQELGNLPALQLKSDELQQVGYEAMFLTLEALCSDVASANGLSGTNVYALSNMGADLIEERYLTFSESFQNVTGMSYRDTGMKFSFLQILALERPTPAMRDILKNTTMLEWIAAKLGMKTEWVKEKLDQTCSFMEMKALSLAEAIPPVWRDGVQTLTGSVETFSRWAGATGYQVGQEFAVNLPAAWSAFSAEAAAVGGVLKVVGNGVLEWTIEGPGRGADAGLALWQAAHRHHLTGPILTSIEAQFPNVQEKSFEQLSEIPELKRGLLAVMNKAGKNSNARNLDNAKLIDKWMQTMLITNNTNRTARMIRFEQLKRSVYSYILAERVADLFNNIHSTNWVGISNGKYEFSQPLSIRWPDDVRLNDGVFTASPNTYYSYIYYSFQNPGDTLLNLFSRDDTFLGYLNQVGQGSGVLPTSAAVSHKILSFVLYENAPEYLKNDLKVLEATIAKERENFAPGDDQSRYEAYARTLMMNVLMETAILNPPDGTVSTAPHLTVAGAKSFYANVITTRSKMLESDRLGGFIPALTEFLGLPVAEPAEMTSLLNDAKAQNVLHRGNVGAAAAAVAGAAPAPAGGGGGGGAPLRGRGPRP